MSTLKLVSKRADTAERVREKLEELLRLAIERDFTACAVVLAHTDGTTFTSALAQGNRTLLLGAVHDLAFSIARDGDG